MPARRSHRSPRHFAAAQRASATSPSTLGQTATLLPDVPSEGRAPHHGAHALYALDNLRFIRETMERAGQFTAVPGWGPVVMGLTARVTAAVTSRERETAGWLMTW